MCSILIGANLPPLQFQRIEISDISLKDTAGTLRTRVSKLVDLGPEYFDMIYCGNLLKNDVTLGDIGLKSGSMVHVIRRKWKVSTEEPAARSVSRDEINQLVVALQTAVINPAYRNMLQRLGKPEVLENIIAATPGLAEDPVAIAILQDPYLTLQLSDPNCIDRVVEMHPSLAQAANHVAAAIHEDGSGTEGSSSSSYALPYSYSVDALSEDDEMDSSQSSDSANQGDSATSTAITSEHLAAALAAAGVPSASGESWSSGLVDRARSSSRRSTAGDIISQGAAGRSGITSEMVSRAMQDALSSAFGTNQANAGTGNGSGSRAEQLQQMREMGITDDPLSLQALEATDGNLQQAVDLIFSDWTSEHQ